MTAIRRRGRGIALLAAAGLLLTACGPHTQKTIGIRSTALSLQFAKPDLAKPIPPNVIVRILPVPSSGPSYVTTSDSGFDVPTPPAAGVNDCPPPKPAVALKESTHDTPPPGSYEYTTKGQSTVSDGTQTAHAPIPELTQVAISAPTKVTPGTAAPAEGGAPDTGNELLYTVITQLSDTVKQIDRLVVSATSINLAERTLVDGRRSLTFTPSPQVQLVVFGPVGTKWRSNGADSSSSATLAYQGEITAVTKVEVCGQPVNAYVVTYSETLTSPLDQELIRTVDGSPNTITIAPQLGGLVVGQQVSTDDLRYDSDLGGYIEVFMDYSSTLRRLEPKSTGQST